MFKIPFLRNILLVSLVLILGMPIYEMSFIDPAYRALLTERTESEAVRFVRYLVRNLALEGEPLSRETLYGKINREAEIVMQDKQVVKLRIYSPEGIIIYSTWPDEIGIQNDNRYFQQIVARGQLYSKVVKKDRLSAEGVRVAQDVVETYVPVMTANGFGGAMEVYLDITESRREIAQLNRNSRFALIALCLGLLGLMMLTLRKAYRYFADQLEAEAALQSAKDDLEVKVEERTCQLQQSNQQLKDEISEKTLTQMALRSALADSQTATGKIDAILQSVTDGLLVVDLALKVVLANPVMQQMFDIEESEVVGKDLSEAFGHSEAAVRIRQAFIEREEVRNFDLFVEDRTYLGRLSPVYNEPREETATILLLQDVTQARELDKLKSDFLAMAAHELHTPITTIMGYSELLGEEHSAAFSPEQRQEFIEIIHRKAEALANIVDDLLDISRMEAGQSLNLHLNVIALRQELGHLLEKFRRDFPFHRFDAETVAADLMLTADLQRFRQLMQNIIDNAVKYSPVSGNVMLAAETIAEGVLISVRDRGIGMTPEQVEKAFDRFYRADTSNTAVSGTGLGLSVVRNIIKAHGGRVWIESRIGEGTSVFCFFPFIGMPTG